MPRHTAKLAALIGDFDRAKAGYAEAIEFCERISYRPELALTRLDLAQLLLHYYPRERGEAQRHLDIAISEFEAMNMPTYLERALDLRAGHKPEPAAQPAYPDGLSEREVEVLKLIASGRSNRDLADALVLSVRTVERHIANLYTKTAIHSKSQATDYAHRHGLT